MVAAPARHNLTIPSLGGFVALDGAPTPGRKRFRKDILRAGDLTLDAGAREITVTPQDLRRIADNFTLAASRGVRVPVVWGHPADMVDGRNNLGRVESLEISPDGQTLFATFWAAESQADLLASGAADEVSVRIDESWVDGKGNRYAPMLTHLGIVNLPVLAGQGPMIALSLNSQTPKQEKQSMLSSLFRGKKPANHPVRRIQLAEGETEGDGEGESSPTDNTLTLDEARELFAEAGINLPDEAVANKDAFVAALKAYLGVGSEEESPAEEAVYDAPAPDLMPLTASTMRRRGRRPSAAEIELATLKKQLAQQGAAELAAKKAAYDARLAEHLKAGRLVAAQKAPLELAGKASGYDLAILAHLDGAPAKVNTGRPKSMRLATGAVSGGDDEAESLAAARSFWGIKDRTKTA